MKKIFSMLICFIILFSNTVFAIDNQLIADKISDIWLSPVKDADALENIKMSIKKK